MHIYHIASQADWRKATENGAYRISTRGKTLDEQGFIHAGDAEQVAPVANLVYGSDDGLIVLAIDVDRLHSEVRYDSVPGWDRPFPHVYGPLNIDAVVATLPLDRGSDGRFAFSVTTQQ
jgi:uncharacterized protein (DUF952 family)